MELGSRRFFLSFYSKDVQQYCRKWLPQTINNNFHEKTCTSRLLLKKKVSWYHFIRSRIFFQWKKSSGIEHDDDIYGRRKSGSLIFKGSCSQKSEPKWLGRYIQIRIGTVTEKGGKIIDRRAFSFLRDHLCVVLIGSFCCTKHFCTPGSNDDWIFSPSYTCFIPLKRVGIEPQN